MRRACKAGPALIAEGFAKRYQARNWQKYIDIDERNYRPNEVNILQGNVDKAKKVLGWQPKTKFTALANLMMDYELKNLNKKIK